MAGVLRLVEHEPGRLHHLGALGVPGSDGLADLRRLRVLDRLRQDRARAAASRSGWSRMLGGRTLGLGYAIALADLALAPGTPSNTGRSAGIVFPVIRNIPASTARSPGPSARRIGAYVMWTAFAATAVTSSTVPHRARAERGRPGAREAGHRARHHVDASGSPASGRSRFLLVALVPLLVYVLYPPEIKTSPEVPAWAAQELRRLGPLGRPEKRDGGARRPGRLPLDRRLEQGHRAPVPGIAVHRRDRRRPARERADARHPGDRVGRHPRATRAPGTCSSGSPRSWRWPTG